MSKISRVNLSQYVDKVEYDYGTSTLMFYTDINGYLIPMSMVHIELEPTDTYFPKNINALSSLYGITAQHILDGIKICKELHGYS